MFRTVPLSITRSFSLYTQQWYVIQVCWQLASCQQADSSKAVNKPVWHIPLLCVQWKTAGDGQRNCPKHVEFCSKNKFEKLVHLVGFIIRIYHDARTPERQIFAVCYYKSIWSHFGAGIIFLILAHSVYKNVNNTGTKYVRIMKQTAFWREENGEYIHHV